MKSLLNFLTDFQACINFSHPQTGKLLQLEGFLQISLILILLFFLRHLLT